MLKRLRAPGVDRRIAADMLVVAAFAFTAKLGGAAKEMAIAWRYGLTEVVDGYLFVFNLVNLPISIWYSVLTVLLIPLISRLRTSASSDALPRFRSEMLGLTLAGGAVLGVVWYAALATILGSRLFGFSDEVQGNAFAFAHWFWLLIPVGMMIQLGSVSLLSEGRHRNTLYEGIPSLVLLIAVLAAPKAGVEPLIWGVVLGYLAHLAAVTLSLAAHRSLRWPRLSFESPAWSPLFHAARLMVLAQVLQTIGIVVDQFFAANLGDGAIATLGYSNRIVSLVVTLGATAVARATLPVLSGLHAEGQTGAHAAAMRWSRGMFVVGIVAAALVWVGASVLVSTLFERGAFSAADTQAVAGVLRFAALQLPFYFSALVLMQGVFAARRYRVAVAIGLGNLLTKITLAALLVPVLGLKGLVLSTAAMYLSSLIALRFFMKRPHVA